LAAVVDPPHLQERFQYVAGVKLEPDRRSALND